MGKREPYEAASSQLLRAVRGARSQVQLARRLGYRGNPITDWEHGRRFPTAVETLRVCERSGIDVSNAFEVFHPGVKLLTTAGAHDLGQWLNQLRGSRTVLALANESGRSRYAVARWLSGKAQPRLPDFLLMVDVITGRAPELVAELVDIEAVPSLRARYVSAKASKQLAMEEPWTEAILRVLECESYRALEVHSDAFIAGTLGISEAEVHRCIQQLKSARIVVRRRHKYLVVATLNVDTRAHPQSLDLLRAHWSQVVAKRAGRLSEEETFGYNVMSIRRDDLDEVRQILRRAYREIRSLAAASEPRETVALIAMAQLHFEPPK